MKTTKEVTTKNQINLLIDSLASLKMSMFKTRFLKIKGEEKEEKVEITKELCLNCECSIIGGIPFEDGHYCNDCAECLDANMTA